jgi:hypothetical protein
VCLLAGAREVKPTEKTTIADHTSFPRRIAGNPDDPIKKEGESAAHGGMSAEDRRLSESVARSVMRITHDVKVWDETGTVSSIFWTASKSTTR